MILNEREVKLPYGCLMITFNLPKWEWFVEKLIKEEDLRPQVWMEDKATYEQMHVTVLYGFEPEVELDTIKPLLLPLDEIEVEFLRINSFENKEFDVVKFEAKSEQLSALNKVLSTLPNKPTYSYNPHATIAYVKPGLGKKYNKTVKPFILKPSAYLFSSANGSKEEFTI